MNNMRLGIALQVEVNHVKVFRLDAPSSLLPPPGARVLECSRSLAACRYVLKLTADALFGRRSVRGCSAPLYSSEQGI